MGRVDQKNCFSIVSFDVHEACQISNCGNEFPFLEMFLHSFLPLYPKKKKIDYIKDLMNESLLSLVVFLQCAFDPPPTRSRPPFFPSFKLHALFRSVSMARVPRAAAVILVCNSSHYRKYGQQKEILTKYPTEQLFH